MPGIVPLPTVILTSLGLMSSTAAGRRYAASPVPGRLSGRTPGRRRAAGEEALPECGRPVRPPTAWVPAGASACGPGDTGMKLAPGGPFSWLTGSPPGDRWTVGE